MSRIFAPLSGQSIWHNLGSSRKFVTSVQKLSSNVENAPKKEAFPWNYPNLRRKFVDELGIKLGFKTREDWYKVTLGDFQNNGGWGLVKRYGSSKFKILSSIYPDYDWKPHRFETVPRRHWDSLHNQRALMDEIATKLSVKTWEDWYQVHMDDIAFHGGGGVLDVYAHSVHRLLENVYPEHPWYYYKKPSQGTSKSQRSLYKAVFELFPDVDEMLMNFIHPAIQRGDGSLRTEIELDIWIPSLSLAFEYQGKQHYSFVDDNESAEYFGDFSLKDQEKLQACRNNGILLVSVPYWWDRSKESLQATIHEVAPHIMPDAGSGTPIPKDLNEKRK